jgi:hypothetical protein
MNEQAFGLAFVRGLVERSLNQVEFVERTGDDDGPLLSLTRTDNPTADAGYLRLWSAVDDSQIDRMIHFRLQSDPVDTQLFFLFGRADLVMPHFHAQVVQFAPDACVFNCDWLPRLDPVEHPDYFTEVFSPITKDYWKAINNRDNVCALAPANPAIAALLSPWSIGVGRPTTKDELDRVTPQIDAFHQHCLTLAHELDYKGPAAPAMIERDRKHLDTFFADALDPRAWKGVYGVIGETAGQKVKQIFKTPTR